MNEYVELVDFKATLDMQNETYGEPDLAQALEAASRSIDKATGRRFWLDDDATRVRRYSPWAVDLLPIDDLVLVTSIKTDESGAESFGTTWGTADYRLAPYNAPADLGEPYTHLHMRQGGTKAFTTTYAETVQITGQFGWPAVPAEVKTACTLIAARLVKRTREAPFGIAAIGGFDAGAARISRTDPDVVGLLAPFARGKLLI